MAASKRLVAVLNALEITPDLLMREMGIGRQKAINLLEGRSHITYNDFQKLKELTGLRTEVLIRGSVQ